jgi:hypothetical protein
LVVVFDSAADIISQVREKQITALARVGLHGEAAPEIIVVGVVVGRVEHHARVLSTAGVFDPQARDRSPLVRCNLNLAVGVPKMKVFRGQELRRLSGLLIEDYGLCTNADYGVSLVYAVDIVGGGLDLRALQRIRYAAVRE